MFAFKFVGDAIGRERCDQVVYELTNEFFEAVNAFKWDPSITDFDAAFNDLKEKTLKEYDVRVGAKSTDKDDSQNSIRRRILGRNIDKERDTFKTNCASQSEALKIENISNEYKIKAEGVYHEIEANELPMKKSALYSKCLSVNFPLKTDFQASVASVTDQSNSSNVTTRLQDFNEFLSDQIRKLNVSNKNVIQAMYEYKVTGDFELTRNIFNFNPDMLSPVTTTAVVSPPSSPLVSVNGQSIVPVATHISRDNNNDNNTNDDGPHMPVNVGNSDVVDDDTYAFVTTHPGTSDDDNDETHTL